MKLSPDTMEIVEKEIEAEVERRMRDYPIHILINGVEMDCEHTKIEGGETFVYFKSPLYCGKENSEYEVTKVWEE